MLVDSTDLKGRQIFHLSGEAVLQFGARHPPPFRCGKGIVDKF